MATICIVNHKGGVGKTTSVANIGAGLNKLGKRVLLVDLDPQCNLSDSFGFARPPLSIYDALRDGKPAPVVTIREGFDLIPASLDLAGLELEIASRLSRETLLKRTLAPLKKSYDFIIIDSPPSLGLLTINGLIAADEVIIPLEAEFLAYRGIDSIVGIIENVKLHFNENLFISGVFLTKYNRQRILTKSIRDEVYRYFGDVLLQSNIRVNVALAEAPANGQDVINYAPDSKGAEDYMNLVEEYLNRPKL